MEKLTGKKDTQWFLVTEDPHTNEVIASALSRVNEAAGNDITFVDNKSKERNGWRVSFNVLNTFLKARKTNDRLKFLPFVKEGDAPPREWKLPNAKKVSKKVAEVREKLSQLKDKK